MPSASTARPGVSADPDGTCAACREIDAGRFPDLIEVDAASRTKVDDTRELLDNVQYAPTRGRYKVYLIDEVHMLSTHSFNALLKTLEEPPPHVKFLLATTDPQKLPVTVLSRCLQFNLKRLPVSEIAGHLRHILEAEGVPFEPAGVKLVAQAADGSMRDGQPVPEEIARELECSAREVRDILRMSQQPISLEKPIGEEEESELGDFVEDQAAESPSRSPPRTCARRTSIALAALPQREREVIEMRFGLTGGRPRTLEEVGRAFNVTRERIRQIENHTAEEARVAARGAAAARRAR